jgi:uncharacterized membrane protein
MAAGGGEQLASDVSEHVAQALETSMAIRARADEKVDRHQRTIERITLHVGRPRAIYVVFALVVTWSVYNAAAPSLGLWRLDEPPFFWLQGLISLGSLLVSIMVLTTQNREKKDAEHRAHLDLQINLLSEQKVAKLIALLEELRRDLPMVRNREDPVASAMAESVDAHLVLNELEKNFEGELANDSFEAEGEAPPP